MKVDNVETFVVGNPPPHYGGQYFIFIKAPNLIRSFVNLIMIQFFL